MKRRDLLLSGGAAALAAMLPRSAFAADAGWLDARRFGARGDGKTIDTAAINRAIAAAAARGGGTVYFPAGHYASYTIRLMSAVTLHLDPGAILLAAAPQGDAGYDRAEPIDPAYEHFQDFGHSHWRNSLIHGEGLHDIAIAGGGLIWGKGLGRGDGKDGWLKDPNGPGTGNKAIALKNCHNVLLRDFRLLEGGWFGILATGVDNLTIDNLIIDTNRDGMDIDCCRNVRVSNCTVNSPYDDGICPKSSFALGYPRTTENLTITNCYVTGNYQVGSVIDGSWKKMPADFAPKIHGRIKCGTESNGGFRNITISNCVIEDSRGIALETVDGATIEDVTISNIAMRGTIDGPLFLRLGRRMRGPAGRPIGTLKRVLIQNVSSSGANLLPSVIAGLPGHPIEDVQISDCHFQHVGGAPAAMATLTAPENELGYPEATMFGDLPASGFFVRHARGLRMSNVEVETTAPDPRAAFRLEDVDGASFLAVRAPRGRVFALDHVTDFTTAATRGVRDQVVPGPANVAL
ncbi:glycoside hydrolase family 28 protein [Sphingomonas sp. H39-1-10]|uniref:rhamnogalacturonidase n=1 Tax=Sphingomonas pollutisoli TaxID=3030829 RepID=UPI0023B9EFFE|nr:glycoside hydrolase family 28 protein [Sphingomonas pollutisoli]MDF0486747.1 glycoside hydrolase family 28 protein [Sphingomonas pollutisoli]